MSVEEAREKLDKLADPKTPPKQEGGEAAEQKDEKDDDDAADKKDKEPGTAPRRAPAKGDDDEGETRILWKLAAGAPYQWVFIKAGKDEKITAVYGYCWPDQPIPFDRIGDVSKAPFHSSVEVAWDSIKPPLHYRIVADGAKESAAQVSIALVSVPTNGVHKPARQ